MDNTLVFLTVLIVACNGSNTEPKQCYSLNEILACRKDCPPEKTCRNRGIFFSCLDDGKKCISKCVCKAGYVRNIFGECIEEKRCDQCAREHEYFSCGSACDNECSKLAYQNKTNCPIKNIKCNEKCYCEDEFARDNNGNCVSTDKCPKRQCGQNEEYSCKSCPPETCMSLVARFKCDSAERCIERCVCKPGFLRKDAISSCIPLCECPQMKNSPDCKS